MKRHVVTLSLHWIPLHPVLALALTLALAMLPAATLHAEIKLSKVFSPHMVLQRDMPVAIWGTASPGEQVAVSFRDQFGTLPKLDGEGASIKGLRLAVPDIDATERVLKSGGVASHRHIGRLVVPSGVGATLIFETPSKI